jgi:RNA polymerase sigma factor (sigma-70 family)
MSRHYSESGFGVRAEAALFHQAQAGCSETMDELMARHDGLVHAVVRQQVLGDLPFGEALQAGRIGLWHAILGYDPSRGWAFSTYAYACIKHQVWGAVKAHTWFWSGRRGCVLPVDGREAEPAVVWQQAAIREALGELVGRLPRRLRYVVIRRYGLDGHEPALYRQIGAQLGITGERARQLHTEALVWMRHPGHSYRLRNLLERHTLAAYAWADALAQQWLRRRGGRHGR